MSDVRKLVIGFSAKARHGKNESVDTIYHRYKNTYDIERMSFADPLRDEIHQRVREVMEEHNTTSFRDAMAIICAEFEVAYDPIAPVDEKYIYGKQRALLQYWGTEWRRREDPNYWVKKLDARIAESEARIILIDDVRFLNEVFFIEDKRLGHMIRINRLNFDNGLHDNYVAETQLDDYSFKTIINVNNGDLDGLRSAVVAAFDGLIEAQTLPDEIFEPFVDHGVRYTLQDAVADIEMSALMRSL